MGGSAKGMVKEGRGRGRWWEGIPEACRERADLPANRVKHCATRVWVSGCAGGQRDGEKQRGGKGEHECREC